MSKYNLKQIMTHAWNIVRCAMRKGKKVYIADAMKKAWTKAKEVALEKKENEEFVKTNIFTTFEKETEKAIALKMPIEFYNNYSQDQNMKFCVLWFPKVFVKKEGNRFLVKAGILNQKIIDKSYAMEGR